MSRSYEEPKHTENDQARVSKMKDGRVRVICTCGYRTVPMLSGRMAQSVVQSHMTREVQS